MTCLSGHRCGTTGFHLLSTGQSAFLSRPSYSGMFIQACACLLVVCSEHHRVIGRPNIIYVKQLFAAANALCRSEKFSLKRCRISEITAWLIHHFGFAWHLSWTKVQKVFFPWMGGESFNILFCIRTLYWFWLFLSSLWWSESRLEFHRLSSCSVSNCRCSRWFFFLPSSSALGLCILMKCPPPAFAMGLLSLLFAAVHIDPK